MIRGSIDPSMEVVMGMEGLSMFKGAPAHGEYPAEPMTMEMEGMSMNGVMVRMVAADNDSNDYHFMPHVAWVEPGTQVIWAHADIEGEPGSEPRAHSVTSFGAGTQFPRLIPRSADHFDSGYIAGLHGQKPDRQIDERFNRRISERMVYEDPANEGDDPSVADLPNGRGPFTHTFEEEGVYLYFCQNHHMFKMAGAIVVGELWGEGGTEAVEEAHGWAPAMTTDAVDRIPKIDELHGHALLDQIHEVREMVHTGGESMGHGGGGGGHDE